MLANVLDSLANPYQHLQDGYECQRSPYRQQQPQAPSVVVIVRTGADPNKTERPDAQKYQADFHCHTPILARSRATRSNEVTK